MYMYIYIYVYICDRPFAGNGAGPYDGERPWPASPSGPRIVLYYVLLLLSSLLLFILLMIYKLCVCTYVYIYIYIRYRHICIYTQVCTYIYIYIYIRPRRRRAALAGSPFGTSYYVRTALFNYCYGIAVIIIIIISSSIMFINMICLLYCLGRLPFRDLVLHQSLLHCIVSCVYIYIYIYIQRERDRDMLIHI